ncbi:dnaJ homolog subfamily C member 28 [Culicoides brevitarsis]|uniref:dnaJ homolog subfamily C member 28 n=1 Tax=Culicoides brevitarsis TaxID=469753 RepID=UPI00307C9B5A
MDIRCRLLNIALIDSRRILVRNLATKAEIYEQCYQILGVDEFSDQNTVRNAYISLVKKLHPDSGHAEANQERFQEVDQAFKILQGKFAKARRGIFEDLTERSKGFDIRHTAPQHRQYLSYEGIGSGTLAQRERQYQQYKAVKAQGRVLEFRVQKAQATEGAVVKKGEFYKKHAIKTKYGFDRVVEDLIQEAMSRGDFQNLKGVGKPLDNVQSQNPYVDFTTHKLNKILMDNGFVPEWIMLQKEINEEIAELKQSLAYERAFVGKLPLTKEEIDFWDEILQKHEESVTNINKKIDKFNLIVPVMDKQLMQIQLKRISDRILNEGKCARDGVTIADRKKVRQYTEKDALSQQDGLSSFFSSIFSAKK